MASLMDLFVLTLIIKMVWLNGNLGTQLIWALHWYIMHNQLVQLVCQLVQLVCQLIQLACQLVQLVCQLIQLVCQLVQLVCQLIQLAFTVSWLDSVTASVKVQRSTYTSLCNQLRLTFQSSNISLFSQFSHLLKHFLTFSNTSSLSFIQQLLMRPLAQHVSYASVFMIHDSTIAPNEAISATCVLCFCIHDS